jgi:dCMP deaminase
MRKTWAEVWMEIALAISERSYDPRLKVGSIIVSDDNHQMLALGYNGNYMGGPNQPESLEPGQSGFLHAEINALVKCDYNFHKNKIMYVTHSPCKQCCKAIVNGGIKGLVYKTIYRDPSGLEILKESNIKVYSIEEAVDYYNSHISLI